MKIFGNSDISAEDVWKLNGKYNLQLPNETSSGAINNRDMDIQRDSYDDIVDVLYQRSEEETKMNLLPVIPHVGIGPLKLGMSLEQILENIKQLDAEWNLPDKREIQISKDAEIDGVVAFRYIKYDFFFMVQYRNNQAVEIAVDYELRNHAMITIYDKDVFKTTAEDMITFLKQFSSCSYDLEDELLSTNYEFPEIGVRLWRGDAFHQKLLSDKSYMEEMALVIEDMYQYLYFEIIAVQQ